MFRLDGQVGFDGGFAEFLEFLRTDERFYAKTGDELLKEAAYISKTMDGKLPVLFKTLPRLPYTVEPVPADIAPKYTAGRYVSPPQGSTQPSSRLPPASTDRLARIQRITCRSSPRRAG